VARWARVVLMGWLVADGYGTTVCYRADLVPRVASPTNVPALQIADRYAAGRRHD
jgi:hypothetical protein